MQVNKLNSKKVGIALAYALHDAAQRHVAGYDREEDTHKYTVLQSCELSCERYNLAPEFAPLMELLLNEQWDRCLEWADNIKK